jgi:hypothetical protein
MRPISTKEIMNLKMVPGMKIVKERESRCVGILVVVSLNTRVLELSKNFDRFTRPSSIFNLELCRTSGNYRMECSTERPLKHKGNRREGVAKAEYY